MAMFLMIVFLSLLRLSVAQDECKPTRCHRHGPTIRFPFRLKDRQPDHCGYPGFDLSCSKSNETVLELPISVEVYVRKIDYSGQLIHVGDPNGCFLPQLRNISLSASQFKFKETSLYDLSIFSCPPKTQDYPIKTCIADTDPGRRVFATYSFAEIDSSLISCKKMYNIPSIPPYILDQTFPIKLKWPQQICGDCQAHGKYCRLKNNSSQNEFECFGYLKNPNTSRVIAAIIIGVFLLAVAVGAVCYAYRLKRRKEDDQAKIEKFLEDYNALRPARYSYADIKKITNHFEDKVGQGAYGTVYKGKLSNDVHVAVKILNSSKGNGDEFINEVGIIGKIHHVNVVRLVGYCADGCRRALIYEFLPNDSLEKYVSSDLQRLSLGWKKLENIALGIAKGIEYLHQGCDQRILHFDIKPHNVLLDHNLNPKVSDFGQAKLCSKEQSAVSMTTARGTIGYIAPEVFSRNFGNVSYKSDVYSFGMLLLEMVGGKKNIDVSQIYFPEWIYNQLNNGEELRIQVQEDGDAVIVRKLAIVGLGCIQWHPTDRPSMKVVVQMLEGDGSTLTMPPNPFASTNSAMTRGKAGRLPFNHHLEVISE